MKRLVILGIFALSFLPVLRADDISDNFNTSQQGLDALTEDLGTAVGAGSFHHGKALGFPIGIDIGFHVPVVSVQNDNVTLRDNDDKFSASWIQAEVGLPMNINVIARGGQVFDADMIGGGLKIGLFKSSLPGIPSVSISGLYSKLDHDLFDMETYTGNAVLSFDLPFVDPYVGVGYDSSKLEAKVTGVPDGEAGTTRAELGVNLAVIPFTYISLAAGTANSESFYHGGVGFRF